MSFEEVINKIKSVPSEIWWRVLSYILSTFFLVPNITLMMFLIYMAEHNFFSYDFFIEGIFGMKLFFLTTVILLLITAFIIYSPLLLYFAKRKGKCIEKYIFWIAWITSGATWLLLISRVILGSDLARMIFIVAICAFIILHVSILIFYNAKEQFISLSVVTISIVFLSFNFPAQSSQAISIGLQAFGVGGDLPITITSAQSGVMTKGKLKLITPKNIYFTPEGETGVATYSLPNVDYYIVGAK